MDSVELAVRLTARLSATAFAVALALFATRPAGRPAIAALAVFIGIHSVHFATIVALAAITGGANVRDRGGWVAALIVAALFYTAAFTILRSWRRAGSGRVVTAGQRTLAHASAIAIWLIFMNSYVSRIPDDRWFAIPAVLLTLALAAYLRRGIGAGVGDHAAVRSLQ